MRFLAFAIVALLLSGSAMAQEHNAHKKWELFLTPWGSGDFPAHEPAQYRFGVDIGATHNWEWGHHVLTFGPGFSVNTWKEFGPLLTLGYFYTFGPGEKYFFGPELLVYTDFTTHHWVASGALLGPVIGVQVERRVALAVGFSAMLSAARVEAPGHEGEFEAVPGGIVHVSVMIDVTRHAPTKLVNAH